MSFSRSLFACCGLVTFCVAAQAESGLPNGLSIVSEADWSPRNTLHVTNPRPQLHAEFTSALSNPNLWWADSFRPFDSDQLKLDHYYGERMHGGRPDQVGNRRVAFDASHDATKQLFKEGEKGISLSNQTRIRWPDISPDNASMASVQWQYRISKDGWRGGKQFQIQGGPGRLHAELNIYGGYGEKGHAGNWAAMPAMRTYFAAEVGGWGTGELLIGGSRESCAGIFRCPIQPNLGQAGMNTLLKESDHVSLGGNQYLVGDESLSGWVTLTVTFDWRDPENHKLWLHASDDRTPRTLIIGIADDGYPIRWGESESKVNGFWLEFNNSRTVNESDSHVWVRNLIVMKDQFAWQGE